MRSRFSRAFVLATLLATLASPALAQHPQQGVHVTPPRVPETLAIGTNPASPKVVTDTGVSINTLINVRFLPSSGATRATPFFTFLQVPTGGAALPFYGSISFINVPNTVTGTTSALRGAYHLAQNAGTNTSAELTGTMSWAVHSGSGTQNNMSGARAFAHQIGSGTVSSMRGLHAEVYLDPGGEGDVTNAYGVKIDIVHSNVGAGRWQALYGTAVTQTGPAAEVQAVGHYVGELAGPTGAVYSFWSEGVDDPIHVNSWFQGAERSPTATKTANYTATLRDGVILCDATAGAVVITLPAVADAFLDGNGLRLVVKKIDASANACTIDPSGAETVDGAATLDLSTQNHVRTIVTNGVAWYVIGS